MSDKFVPFAPAFPAPAASPKASVVITPDMMLTPAQVAAPTPEPVVTPETVPVVAKVAPVPKGQKAAGTYVPGSFGYTFEETILEVDNLSVAYATPVLRDVSFKLRNIVRPGLSQGQVIALLAPSGKGKTQLFRCISGLKMPNTAKVSGSVYLGADRTLTSAGKVGVVAQDYPLFTHLTVYDNILMAAKLKLSGEEAAARTMELLERFDLSERKDFYPHQLSGGQRQRVAIIQEMVACGHMLLMDEPFSGLDVLMKERVQDMITTLAAEDELNTIMLTTHDIQSAIAVADTILLLGCERGPDGASIPGAKIVKEYNLIDLGLTWRENNHELPQFAELDREINARFHEL